LQKEKGVQIHIPLMWLQMRFQTMPKPNRQRGFYSDGWQGLDAGPKSLANFEK
jgi:phosphoglycerate kinase